jgi:hypothetical protein
MRQRKHTKESLEPHVKKSHNWASLLISLGFKQSGGMHRYIKQRVKEYGLDYSHFPKDGAWSRGLTKDTSEVIKRQSLFVRTPDEKVFCENSGFSSSKLYERLLEKGFENKCSNCSLSSWLNKPLRLHVDHRNGKHSDNRIENLQFLCPNCHQQTDTWGAKNKKAS